MQIKLITIPVMGGEMLNEELNLFLRSKRVLQVEQKLVETPQGAMWTFCIRYLDDVLIAERAKGKIDYREVLDEVCFQRFSDLRVIRKQIAMNESVPAYAVFTDEELAGFAKIELPLTVQSMRSVKGVGEKKVDKYAAHFVTPV
jgi:superfamily II DNA helicase RecQ